MKEVYPSVTMYVPTHKSGSPPHVSEDSIRFKNLRSQVLKILKSYDNHSDFVHYFDKVSKQLEQDREFWEDTGKSLLICVRPGMFEFYNLPIDSDEYIAVDDRFHIAPVAGMLEDLQHYYVLNLSLKNPAVYSGDAFELIKQDIGLPTNVRDALNIDEMHLKSLQFSSVDGKKGAMYHGQGGAKDTGDDEKMKYFRIIDHIIQEKLNTNLPLVLAGVPSELSAYRGISSYPELAQNQVEEHFSEHDMQKLHELASQVIYNERVAAIHKEMAHEYSELLGNPELVSDQLDAIEQAARSGRVKSLLMNMQDYTRDTVRDNMARVQKLKFMDNSDIVDDIAQQVLMHGGKIMNLPRAVMPQGKMVLSINRY